MAKRFSRLAPVFFKIVVLASVTDVLLPLAYAQDPLSRFLDGIFKPEITMPQQAPGFEYKINAPFDEGQFQSEAVLQTAPSPTTLLPPTSPSRSSEPITPKPSASVSGIEAPRQPVEPSTISRIVPPLPPVRPAGIGIGAGVDNSSNVQAVKTPAKPVSPRDIQHITIPRNAPDAIAMVSAYLNGIHTLTSRFLQTGADGRQVGGTLYVQRPGRMRFAYDPPSTLEIVADGKSVAVRDAKLRTNDVYSIGQTPLKFLLQDNVDLARDVKVRYVDIDPRGTIELTLEDSSTLGGTSTITLRFDARSNVLREWVIVDPQGYQTTVTLSNVEILKR